MPDLGDDITVKWYKDSRTDPKGKIIGYILKPDEDTKRFFRYEGRESVDVKYILVSKDSEAKKKLQQENKDDIRYAYLLNNHMGGGRRHRTTKRKTRKH
jgi:hypothetical protein